MKISEFKNFLSKLTSLNFVQTNGENVPNHFHITEAGLTTKHFVDCGGTERMEKSISFQLWVAEDTEHRLSSSKLLSILKVADKFFGEEDLEVEIEYQTTTISRFGVDFDGTNFLLKNKHTDCLAKEKCGISDEKQKLPLADLNTNKESACAPGSGCC